MEYLKCENEEVLLLDNNNNIIIKEEDEEEGILEEDIQDSLKDDVYLEKNDNLESSVIGSMLPIIEGNICPELWAKECDRVNDKLSVGKIDYLIIDWKKHFIIIKEKVETIILINPVIIKNLKWYAAVLYFYLKIMII